MKHVVLAAVVAGLTGIACQATAANVHDVVFDDTLVFPESLDVSTDGTLYTSSWKGIVYRALPGEDAKPWIRPDDKNGILSILGVAIDTGRHALWVCSVPAPTRDPPAPGVSTLLAFDLKSGALKLSLPLPAPDSVCNDIAIAADGTAYLSETANGRIFKIRPQVNKLELFAQDDALKGVDGIVFSGSGQLYVNLVTTGALFRVGIDKAGKFAGLTKITPSRSLEGPDGFRLIKGDSFLIAENKAGTIDRVTIHGEQAMVETLKGGLMSPTSAVAHQGVVYGVERKIEYVRNPELRGKDPGTFKVLALPLP
jgi:sugar lactone lactonase YvrE